ncbi:MAG: glucosamine-6-phosphate deaminase [Dysgonamonadaceae bacterium]|jgi:glucosamine-6-phosphate deaminase|nr:glucosamine-6-phosphate deaminase [Dysgonamonadaceae bacterium]
MKITIAKNELEFDTIAAWRIIAEILAHPQAVIGLSTGRTTINMHRIVGEIYRQHPFYLSGITLFGVDEVTNVPREYSGACYTMLKTQIVDALGIKEAQFLMPPTVSNDFEKECRRYEAELKTRGGVDLQVLGLGTNGHLGFNQPGTPFESTTWISAMDEVLEARIRKETNTPPERELGGFTLGLKNIMHSRKIILAAKGVQKAEIVRKMLSGPVTTAVPASILQLHPDCEFLLDVDAAKYIDN